MEERDLNHSNSVALSYIYPDLKQPIFDQSLFKNLNLKLTSGAEMTVRIMSVLMVNVE